MCSKGLILSLKCHLYSSFIFNRLIAQTCNLSPFVLQENPRTSCDSLKVNICHKNEKYLLTGAWRAPWNLVGFECVGILRHFKFA